MKILVINPGSTSTKIAVYENETPLLVRNIKHTVEELSVYPQVIDQFEFRKNLVLQELEANGIPFAFDAVIGLSLIHICAKLNAAKGAWPAIWMLPENAKWPSGGEIDVMERLNDDSIAYQTVHSHYTYTLGIKDHPKSHSTGVIHPDRYNVFAVEMYPDSLSFYVNDIHTFTYPRIQTQKEGQFPFDQPFYLLIDMQLGGSWVGAVDPKDLPVEMEVDWVRFYQRKSLK